MLIVLFRHGIAEPRQPGRPDADRALTGEGEQKTAEAARGLATMDLSVDALLTSPLRRARQTADLLARSLHLAPEVCAPLAEPGPDAVLGLIRSRSERTLVLVGHEPALSAVAGRLCSRGGGAPTIELKKAGCLAVEARIGPGEPGGAGGMLAWALPPRVLRRLGRGR
ncbi:MAG: SixA phosphatase family protein [Phycisphaeraceae bacterium]